MQDAFEAVFDQALVFHGYADYLRDYDLYVYATADPRTQVPPEYLRYRFTHCVRATVSSTIPPQVWSRSLDERLTADLALATQTDLDGFVWGVRWQELYPGITLAETSPEAERWSTALGIPFYEAQIRTNAHDISLVFSDLEAKTLDPGHTVFVIPQEEPDSTVPPR
jgi:hypothetical protein